MALKLQKSSRNSEAAEVSRKNSNSSSWDKVEIWILHVGGIVWAKVSSHYSPLSPSASARINGLSSVSPSMHWDHLGGVIWKTLTENMHRFKRWFPSCHNFSEPTSECKSSNPAVDLSAQCHCRFRAAEMFYGPAVSTYLNISFYILGSCDSANVELNLVQLICWTSAPWSRSSSANSSAPEGHKPEHQQVLASQF